MSKELEEIKNIVAIHFGALGFLNPSENEQILKDRDKVLNAINELKEIKESNPTKALECLEKLNDMFYLIKYRTTEGGNREEYEFYPSYTKEYSTIENYILKAQEKEKDKAFLKNLHNTKVKTPLVDIFNGLSWEKKFAYTEHIYYHWEEMKESLEEEIKTLKDEKETLESKTKKQEKVLKIIFEKNVDIHWIKNCTTLDGYNDVLEPWELALTQKEFDLLKNYYNGYKESQGE